MSHCSRISPPERRTPLRRLDAPSWAGWWQLAVLLVCLSCTDPLRAHVGSPTVFFEGQVGPFQTRVMVHPPEVIPGLATVSVRVLSPSAKRVTALPIRWNTGRQGAPAPDEARLVRGETNLYTAQLWFMQGGAQSVEVEVSGSAGIGKVIVPVNAVATRVLGMPRLLGYILAALGSVLVLLLATIIGAAVRESALAPGAVPNRWRDWLGRGAMLLAAVVLGGLLWFGNRWWKNEAADYHHNRLYQPLETQASLDVSPERRVLRLELIDEKFLRGAPLVPDHGKLMHLFVVREPGLDVFAHLHPQKQDWNTFATELPGLPEGRYALYGDVTFETGLAETLTAQITLTNGPPLGKPLAAGSLDRDDCWRMAPPLAPHALAATDQQLQHPDGGICQVHWTVDGSCMANRETELRFTLSDEAGHPLLPEPYLGMAGHLVLRHQNGTVFTHLHPGGSFSMAAQQLFEMREDGRAPLKVASATNDPICRLPTSAEVAAQPFPAAPGTSPNTLSFPYAFPKPGWFRLWLQVRVRGELLTGVFDTEVLP